MWLTNNYLIKALHDPSVALQKNLLAKFCWIEMQYETALNHKFSEFNKRKCKKLFSSNASSWPYALITYRPQTCFLLNNRIYKEYCCGVIWERGSVLTLAPTELRAPGWEYRCRLGSEPRVQAAERCRGRLLRDLRGAEDSWLAADLLPWEGNFTQPRWLCNCCNHSAKAAL